METHEFKLLILASATVFTFGCSAKNGSTPGTADTVLEGGVVYAVDEQRSFAEAVAIEDGRIVYVGSVAGVESYKGANTEVIGLEGKLVLPAFVESHLHPLTTAYDHLYRATLYGLYTHEEYIAAIDTPVIERNSVPHA